MGEKNDDKRPGFDYFVTHQGQGKYFDNTFRFNGGERREVKGYYTHVVTNMAIEWLDTARQRPPFPAVHGTQGPAQLLLSRAEIRTRLRRRRHSLPADRVPSRRQSRSGTRRGSTPGTASTDRSSTTAKNFPIATARGVLDFANMVRAYRGTILSVDDSVGRIYDYLKAIGELDNTLIIFTTDNGLLEGEHGMVDKRTMHEASIRLPLVVRYPGLTATRRSQGDRRTGADDRLRADDPRHLRCRAAAQGARPVVEEAGAGRRSRLAQELVLRIQLREAVSLHAQRARRAHRPLEVHSLSARRRRSRPSHGRAVRNPQRSPGNTQLDQRSAIRSGRRTTEQGTRSPDSRGRRRIRTRCRSTKASRANCRIPKIR